MENTTHTLVCFISVGDMKHKIKLSYAGMFVDSLLVNVMALWPQT